MTPGQEHVVPGSARAVLIACAVIAVLVSACLAMVYAAGPPSKERSAGVEFTKAAVVLLAVHAGYLLAPMAVGKSWWAWCFWSTAPFGAAIVITCVTLVINMMRWTPVDGGSRWPGILSQVSTMMMAGSIYGGPAVVLWLQRPR